MNSIIKDPHIIRTGQEWFDMLPKELQKKWLFYTERNQGESFVYRRLNSKGTFENFIWASFIFVTTEEGHDYWSDIAHGRFGVIQKKKSLLSKIINFFKP